MDLLISKKLWFQNSEEDSKIMEDGAQAEAQDISGGKGKIS
jgi:hypothetical protein